MAIRKIARMGHEILKKVSEPIADPTAPEITRLAQDLIDTCEDIGGNGIAARAGVDFGAGVALHRTISNLGRSVSGCWKRSMRLSQVSQALKCDYRNFYCDLIAGRSTNHPRRSWRSARL